MGRRIESEMARATIGLTRGIHVLQKLALVLDHSSIRETGAVFHTRNVAAENADSAAVQTTNKHTGIRCRFPPERSFWMSRFY